MENRGKEFVPTYYHSLGPFEKSFRTGLPVLTYHKLGPRPRGVKLKGLYVGERLFARQLGELRAAGFSSPLLSEVLPLRHQARPQIILTFDDGFTNVLRHGLKPLADHGFRAVQFLVANLLGRTNEWDARAGEACEPLMDAGQVREWLAAGHEIGSHSCTHAFLTRLSRDQAREEIEASKRKLEDIFGRPIEHFCYPYGDWNEGVCDLVAGAGYKTGFTTAAGINTPADSSFRLKRFTARYPSRNLKSIFARLRARMQQGRPVASP